MIKLIKIFIIWLLIHFVSYNLVTFWRGLDGGVRNYLRLWKEVVIGIFLWYIVLWYYRMWWWAYIRKALRSDIYIRRFQIGLIVFTILWLGMTLYIHDATIAKFALAFKYDILFLLIFVIGFHLQKIIASNKQKTKDNDNDLKWFSIWPRMGKVIKIMLWLSICRYMIIAIKPGTMKLLWYNNYSFEWEVWEPAPAAYYTNINQWLTRNQFVFERPTTRWFFLIAFWPLFYMLYLHRKPKKHTRVRRSIYGLNIILTFSRAARWAWIFQIIAMWFLLKSKQKSIKSVLISRVLPICIVLWILAYLGRDQIVHRSFSTVGHVDMLVKWRDMFMLDPRRGQWAASAGPGSHRDGGQGFNPENQFLQIMVEFWLLWFAVRWALYGSLHLLWLRKNSSLLFYESEKEIEEKTTTQDTWFINSRILLLALCIWLAGLSISGMVLHSLSDRMVVYPFMLVLGIVYATYTNSSSQN